MKIDGRDNLFKKAINYTLRPPWYVAIIAFIITLTLIAGSLYSIIIELNNIGVYFLYIIAATFLSLTVWYAIYFTPKIKKYFIALMEKRKFTSAIINDYGFRAVTFSTVAFTVNIAYAIFNGAMGIISRSVWFGALSLYYIVLSALKAYVIIGSRRINKLTENRPLLLARMYRNCGISLIMLSIALSGAVAQMALSDQGFKYADLMIYAAALYAFYKITIAIIQFVKSRRHGRTINETFGLINLSDGLVSMLALQTALLAAFGEGSSKVYNAITGTAVMLMIIAIGIFMAFGAKRIKTEKENENDRKQD